MSSCSFTLCIPYLIPLFFLSGFPVHVYVQYIVSCCLIGFPNAFIQFVFNLAFVFSWVEIQHVFSLATRFSCSISQRFSHVPPTSHKYAPTHTFLYFRHKIAIQFQHAEINPWEFIFLLATRCDDICLLCGREKYGYLHRAKRVL